MILSSLGWLGSCVAMTGEGSKEVAAARMRERRDRDGQSGGEVDKAHVTLRNCPGESGGRDDATLASTRGSEVEGSEMAPIAGLLPSSKRGSWTDSEVLPMSKAVSVSCFLLAFGSGGLGRRRSREVRAEEAHGSGTREVAVSLVGSLSSPEALPNSGMGSSIEESSGRGAIALKASPASALGIIEVLPLE